MMWGTYESKEHEIATRKLSKYQEKTLEEYELNDELQCRKCDGWFMFSYTRCKEIVDENGEERFIVYCPYCKFEHRVHV